MTPKGDFCIKSSKHGNCIRSNGVIKDVVKLNRKNLINASDWKNDKKKNISIRKHMNQNFLQERKFSSYWDSEPKLIDGFPFLA